MAKKKEQFLSKNDSYQLEVIHKLFSNSYYYFQVEGSEIIITEFNLSKDEVSYIINEFDKVKLRDGKLTILCEVN